MAKRGERITHIALAIPFILVFIICGSLLSELLIYRLFLKGLMLPSYFKDLFGLIVGFGSINIFLWIWLKFFEKRPFWTIGFIKIDAFKNYLKGFLSGLLMISFVVLVMFTIGKAEFIAQNNTNNSFGLVGIVFLFLIGFVIQGGTEEILARGWQFQVIGARYTPLLGLIISSVIFALLHGLNNGITLIAILNLLFFAILLAVYTLRYNSLWAACGWHSAWNWTMSCVYGLNVSGQRMDNSFLKINFTGPEFLSGGAFGPEGSIITTLLLVVSIIILVYRNKENDKTLSFSD